MKVKQRHSVSIVVGVILALSILAPVSESQNMSDKIEGTPAGWTDDIRLTNNTYLDYKASIASDGNNIHIVWARFVNPQWRIFYINSTDAGRTWHDEVELAAIRTNPDICAQGQNVHVVSDSGQNIFYRNSTDGGATWNAEKMISTNDGFNSEGPKVAVSEDGQSIHVVWVDSRHGSESFPSNTEIYYTRSLDGGITWEVERRLTNVLYGSGSQNIAVEGSTIHVLWGDGRNGVTTGDIYYKVSYDNGVIWQDGLGNVNQDRRLTTNSTNHGWDALAVNGSAIHVIWVDVDGTSYYLYYRNSTDNGVSWNPMQLLTGPTPAIASPDIAVWGNEVNAVWDDRRDDGLTTEIYCKNSTDGGLTWHSDLRLTFNIGKDSYWPRIALANATRHIVWYDNRDANWEIYYKRSPDFPDISPPSHFNETPPPDSFKDPPGTTISVLVTDPSGVNASSIKLYVNGSIVVHSLTPIAGGYNVSYVSLGYESGLIPCRIVANDTLSNHLDYTWSFTVLNSFKIPVVAGWNLISMPLVQPNSNLPSALLDRDGDTLWDRAMSYNASDANDYWKQFNIGWSTSLNDLINVNNRMGLWLNITNVGDGFLNVTGLLPTITQIPLRAGWNLVGYPSLCANMTVGNAFWGTGANIVEVFDQSATYRSKVVGPTYVMKPGQGYWVHVPADSIWIVNW